MSAETFGSNSDNSLKPNEKEGRGLVTGYCYGVVSYNLRSNHTLYIHQSSLAHLQGHLVTKHGETWREISVYFFSELSLSYSAGIFNIP
jgi:hypothetical protein